MTTSNRDDDGFSEEEATLIEALAGGATYDEAGDLIDMSGRTVRRRMTDPALATAVAARRNERMVQIATMLTDTADEALRALRDGLGAEDVYPRLKAAQLILDMVLRYRSAGELADRLSAIERRLDQELSAGDAEGTPS